ncbi:MAG: T9SS type A sorting domain-containing protein, partial [Ignavibacteria bacterium]|nr:T9SS type A sorting domain-containing protein [Ignavibacteria bacterium]
TESETDQVINNPLDYKLNQNYPNPFNPVTNMEFGISKSGFVTLKVYDVLGKEVATLVNEMKQAGDYKVDFNAVNFTSGIYFYKFEYLNFVQTKRMILIK